MSDKKDKIFFASDFHLGVPNSEESLSREKKIVQWLEKTRSEARAYYFVGDIFDFWFEYKRVVPKGFVRLLGKLAEIADEGTPIYVFTGNHDLWMNDYLNKEVGVEVFYQPTIVEIDNLNFYIAHGDGLGPGDKGFKFLKKIFTNSFAQKAFSWLHPDLGVALADYFSSKSRHNNHAISPENFNPEEESQILHAREVLKTNPVNYFIFGHRHFPFEYNLGQGAYYVNLGDWMKHFTYATWDGNSLKLKSYDG